MMNLIKWIFIASQITLLKALNLELIRSFFIKTSTRNGVIFGCLTKTKQIDLAKSLIGENRKIAVLNMKRAGVEWALNSLHQPFGVVLDGDCSESANFLILCGRRKYFGLQYHWLIVSSDIEIKEKLENININIDAQVHVAVKNTSSGQWVIFDVYNPAAQHGGRLNFTQIGYYDEGGYQVSIVQSKYWIRKNMTGVVFRTMVVLPTPFKGPLLEYLNSNENSNQNSFNRYHTRLHRHCSDYYNFTMDISLGKVWGYPQPDGTFDGMVGAMSKNIVDFGNSPIFYRIDRAMHVDYGRHTWMFRASILFRNPKSRTSIQNFIKPLPDSVWLFTICFAILSIVILKIVTTYEKRKFKYLVETSWSYSLISTLGAFCQQGSPSTPRMLCGRITTFTTFFLSVIIYQFYSASIVSHLLMLPEANIKTLKDLLDSPMKMICEDIIYNKDYFKHTTDEVAKQLYYKKILNRKKNTSNYMLPAQGLALVKQGGYAFQVEIAQAYPIIEATFPEKAICELKHIQMIRMQPLHGTYQKNSSFRDIIEFCLHRLDEHGIMIRERNFWHPRKPECIQSSKSMTFNVGLDEFYPALLVLLLGIGCSLFILFLEIQVKVIETKLNKKNDVISPYVD